MTLLVAFFRDLFSPARAALTGGSTTPKLRDGGFTSFTLASAEF
jgi:hypothetical protein